METKIVHRTYQGDETIRVMPQNYLLAYKREDERSWTWEPDLAVDKKVALKLAEMLLEHRYKWGSGSNIVDNFKV